MKRFAAGVLLLALFVTGCTEKNGTRESREQEARSGEVTASSVDETEASSDTSESTERTEKSEDTTTAATTAQPEPDTGLSDQILVKDIIGEVNGDRYRSELGGVSYVIEGDGSFGGRESNQIIYGDVDLDSRLKDLPSNKLVAGEVIMWPDGSNLSISYQYAPDITSFLQDTFLDTTLTQTESAMKTLGYTVDLAEVNTTVISGKECKSIELKLHNDFMKMHQKMIFVFHDNGVITYLSATSAGDKYPIDLILKNAELQ